MLAIFRHFFDIYPRRNIEPDIPDGGPLMDYEISVIAVGFTFKQVNELFDRVADAAHAEDELTVHVTGSSKPLNHLEKSEY